MQRRRYHVWPYEAWSTIGNCIGADQNAGSGDLSLTHHLRQESIHAEIAQVAEQLPCKQPIVGSTPTLGSKFSIGT